MMALPRGAWRALSIMLLVVAVAFAWLAFTRFGATSLSTDSPAEQDDFERDQLRDARLSAMLGLASAFALLGTFACWQQGGRTAPAEGATPKPPEP